MANPVLIAKAAAMVLSNEKIRKGVGWIVVAIISPILVLVAILCGMLSEAANHNNSALDLCFHGGTFADDVPWDYQEHIEAMRDSFAMINGIVNELNAKMENGDSLDPIQIKAVFYSLYFGADQPPAVDCRKFADCFVTYEEHTRTVTMEDGKTKKEIYTVPVPIKDLSVVYQNINTAMGKAATYEDMANATEIYYRIAYGTAAPFEDDSTESWEGWKYQLSEEEKEKLYHDLPAGEQGSEIVKLAMSRLGDPYSQEKRGQGSYTDCSYLTMWCYKQFGISLPGTAAEQGRYCYNNGLTIAKEDLLPGDLVFWSYKPNGRFMNITHVGIYAGDGKVIDAAYSKDVVVYRDLFDSDKQVLYGRPLVKE
jgi:cell wall-associated NlpC family hydrolase